jgi:hypothetical protein
MSPLYKYKRCAILQLVAMAFHTFLLSVVILASAPQVSDREGAYRPTDESRLAALSDFIDATALNRGAKRYDNQNSAGFLASAVFRRLPLHRSTLENVNIIEPIYQLPITGALPIRSPPLQLPL